MAKKSKKNKSTQTENVNTDQVNEASLNEEITMSATSADTDMENSDFGSDLTVDTEIFLSEESESEGFLPDVQD